MKSYQTVLLVPKHRGPLPLFEEDSGSVDPETGTPALARYAKQIGVKIYTNCAVRGIETAGGKISDVVTEKAQLEHLTLFLRVVFGHVYLWVTWALIFQR